MNINEIEIDWGNGFVEKMPIEKYLKHLFEQLEVSSLFEANELIKEKNIEGTIIGGKIKQIIYLLGDSWIKY